MTEATDPLVLDLVEWVGREPRLYSEVIETWRTSCPRLTIWEDALSAGLIERIPGRTLADAQVCITARGLALLRTAGQGEGKLEAEALRVAGAR
jgi:hypothetical protein